MRGPIQSDFRRLDFDGPASRSIERRTDIPSMMFSCDTAIVLSFMLLLSWSTDSAVSPDLGVLRKEPGVNLRTTGRNIGREAEDTS